MDDGDEDAWVHDGIDDIHIDPETKRAASELSRDESSSIDAEYDPSGASGQAQASAGEPIVNRTRITTIAEVIPMGASDLEPTGAVQLLSGTASARYLPAAYLTLDQVQRLVAGRGRGQEELDEQDLAQSQVVPLSSSPAPFDR